MQEIYEECDMPANVVVEFDKVIKAKGINKSDWDFSQLIIYDDGIHECYYEGEENTPMGDMGLFISLKKENNNWKLFDYDLSGD
jgi:hypothetical protein